MSNGSSPTGWTWTWPSRKIQANIVCIILILIVTVGLVCVIAFMPKINAATYRSDHPIEFKITDASITQFNLTSNNTLYYNFKVTITAKNFGNDIESLEGTVRVISSYKGYQLPWVTIEPVVVGSRNTIVFQPTVFEGNITINLKPQELVEYNKETQLRIYNLGLELSEHRQYDDSNMRCRNLRIPLIFDGEPASTFNATTCRYY